MDGPQGVPHPVLPQVVVLAGTAAGPGAEYRTGVLTGGQLLLSFQLQLGGENEDSPLRALSHRQRKEPQQVAADRFLYLADQTAAVGGGHRQFRRLPGGYRDLAFPRLSGELIGPVQPDPGADEGQEGGMVQEHAKPGAAAYCDQGGLGHY